jgi:hypothetical protein
MTPLIRDLRRMRISPRTLLVSARCRSYFIPFVLSLIVGSSGIAVATVQSSQDPNARPAPAPSAQQPPPASTTPAPATPGDSTPAQKPVHQKKVLTEDDLAKPTKAISLNDLDGEENNPVCDLSCEAELRAGFGPEREAEFRNQLTLARHEIADDKLWNSNLQSALQAAGDYCEIQRQKAKILGNGNAPQYVRDDVNHRFSDREGKLLVQYRNSSGLLMQRIQVVQGFVPFRATVMQYQVSEATARVCPDYNLP